MMVWLCIMQIFDCEGALPLSVIQSDYYSGNCCPTQGYFVSYSGYFVLHNGYLFVTQCVL